MATQQTPLFWSIPAGTWFQTRVRISIFFPLIIAVFCVRLGPMLGAIFGGVLFASVLLHEFGHILGARVTGGEGREILIWPLGGLAYVQPAASFKSQLLTPAAGPIVNFLLCLATLAPVLASEHTAAVFNPFVLPPVEFGANWLGDLLLLIFAANWILLLINLLPVYPLDGGRMLLVTLQGNMERHRATMIYTRVGFFVGLIIVFAGLFTDHAWVVAVGALILVLNLYEAVQLQTGPQFDESFMGYDFSQGYTSLERNEDDDTPRRPRQSWLARRRERKLIEKAEREQQQQVEDEALLDELLEKVSNEGFDSLSATEKKSLSRISSRYSKPREE